MAQSNAAQGSLTAAGVACVCSPGADAHNILILLDAKNVGTAALNVSVEVLDPVSGAYVAPALVWGPAAAGVTNPVVVTNATVQLVRIPGSWGSVRVNVPSFGTSTGTFNAAILAA
jgi:hypothetical protein